VIQSNTVVGSDGFGFAKQADGKWYRILQTGSVELGDDVDIGALTAVDRPTLGATVIRSGAKLDNLVQVGHACSVGENSLLCAQVGLAGSTDIGGDVVLAGQVGSAGHLKVGHGAVVTAQSGIPSSVEPGSVISGTPAIDNRRWLRSTAAYSRLPEMQRAIRQIEERLAQIETALGGGPND
jgi:UDP-3-O-[3-hydroxymyristoyl] glucosamine N-acyltransferase